MAREAKASDELPRGEAEPSSQAIERSALGDPALLAFVEGSAERGELGPVVVGTDLVTTITIPSEVMNCASDPRR